MNIISNENALSYIVLGAIHTVYSSLKLMRVYAKNEIAILPVLVPWAISTVPYQYQQPGRYLKLLVLVNRPGTDIDKFT